MMNKAENKSDPKDKYEPGSKHSLGISRTIYAAGYGLKDGIIWGTVAAVGLFAALTVGNKFEIPGIKPFAEGLVKAHNKMHNWFKARTKEISWLKWIEPAVVEASVVTWFLVGHLVQIPSTALGWAKAQDAIDKHDKMLAENQQLAKTTEVMAQDNEKLKSMLLTMKENRPPIAERIRSQAAAAETPSANSI